MDNKALVLNHLLAGNTITAYEGFVRFNIVSVRDYISFLRRDGWNIVGEWRENLDSKKRFKEYYIPKEKQRLDLDNQRI